MTYTILVIDHGRGAADSIEAYLRRGGYPVHRALSGTEALDFALKHEIDFTLIGRGLPKTEGTVLEVAGLSMDKANRTCTFRGKELHLTPKEFAILWKLAEAHGSVVAVEDIYGAVWGEEYFEENGNTIAVHVRRIRKKMAETGVRESDLSIQTVWSAGYRLCSSPEKASENP